MVNLNHLFQFIIYLTTKFAQFQIFCKTFFFPSVSFTSTIAFVQIINHFQLLTSELMSLLQEVMTVFVGLIHTLSVKKIYLSTLLPITFKKGTASHAKNTLMGKLFRRKKSFSVLLSCFSSPVKIYHPLNSSGSSLPLAHQKKDPTLPDSKRKQANRVLEDFCQFARKVSMLQSFFSLTRHLDDARKPAFTVAATHSMLQSRTEQQCCPSAERPQQSLVNLPSLKCLWLIFFQS